MNNYSFNIQDDGLSFLTLKHQPVNTLSQEFIVTVSELFDKISSNPKIKILIISSSLKHFCAGADLKERPGFSVHETERIVSNIRDCFIKLHNFIKANFNEFGSINLVGTLTTFHSDPKFISVADGHIDYGGTENHRVFVDFPEKVVQTFLSKNVLLVYIL